MNIQEDFTGEVTFKGRFIHSFSFFNKGKHLITFYYLWGKIPLVMSTSAPKRIKTEDHTLECLATGF